MKKLLISASLVVLGSVSAYAADLAARPYTKAPPMVAAAYDWSGLYIGINGGGGSARNCWEVTSANGAAISPPIAEGCNNATGGTVGGQLGYRWQAANWVFGLEGQGNWANFTGSNANLITPEQLVDTSKVNAFGLITGQVGYAWNNVLWYVKGGAAVTDNKYSLDVPSAGVTGLQTGSETRWGGAIGTGVEIGFAPNWSLGFEYNHLFMGDRGVNLAGTSPKGEALSSTHNISQDVDMGLVRLNYRFGGPVVARY